MNAQAKVLFYLLLSALVFQKAFAQNGVGIGTVDPHPSSVLEVNSTSGTRGILIPRVPTVENVDEPTAEGLLVYDNSLKQFCFWNGSAWLTLNELRNQAGTTTVTHSGNVTVAGTVSASSYGLNATGNGPVPKGGIIMWSGTSKPTTGWVLCTGDSYDVNGNVVAAGTPGSTATPNLKGRFIVGYDPAQPDYDNPGNGSTGGTTAGDIGGSASVTLTTAQMPSHSHTATASPAGAHSHTFSYTGATGKVVGKNSGGGEDGADDAPNSNGTTSTQAAHTHTITVSPQGSGQAHENRPPYYVLAFIMKL